MSVVDNDDKIQKTLKYADELRYFEGTIKDKYKFKEVEVFRTVRTNPPTDEDLIPLHYQHVNSLEFFPLEITQDIVDALSDEEKGREVGHRALSMIKTSEKCIKEARRALRSYIENKKPSHEAIEDYKKKRGMYVAKFKITPNIGLITDFHKGTHAQVLLYEDVKIEDVWDSSSPVIPFKYEE